MKLNDSNIHVMLTIPLSCFMVDPKVHLCYWPHELNDKVHNQCSSVFCIDMFTNLVYRGGPLCDQYPVTGYINLRVNRLNFMGVKVFVTVVW